MEPMCTKQYTRWYERELVTPSYLFLLHLFFTIKLANSSKESSSRFSESSTRLKKQLGISFPFLQNICMILFGNYQIYHFRSVFCWIKMDKEKKIFKVGQFKFFTLNYFFKKEKKIKIHQRSAYPL